MFLGFDAIVVVMVVIKSEDVMTKSTDAEKNMDNVSMNKELEQWLQESKKDNISGKKIKTDVKKHGKKPFGICQICNAKDAKAVCIKCGRSVCNECFIHLVGLCEKCVPRSVVEKWKQKKFALILLVT